MTIKGHPKGWPFLLAAVQFFKDIREGRAGVGFQAPLGDEDEARYCEVAFNPTYKLTRPFGAPFSRTSVGLQAPLGDEIETRYCEVAFNPTYKLTYDLFLLVRFR